MATIIANNTPQYEGEGQPSASDSDGLLGSITSIITSVLGGGGATPVYVGEGQPVPRQRGLLLFVDQTPEYVPGPVLGPDPTPPNPDQPPPGDLG